VVVLLGAGGFALAVGGDETERPPPEVLGIQLITGRTDSSGLLVVGDERQKAPAEAAPTAERPTLEPFVDPGWERRAGKTAATTTSAADDQSATSLSVPPTTTSTTTTTVTPTTTTSTTTTTVPVTTTTTTVPATTTTTAPTSDAWFAILDASLSCVGDAPVITWSVYDPSEPWSNGWLLVIDGASRGLFAPGTVVTEDGPGVAMESVTVGSHTLVVDRHWETLNGRRKPRGHGSNSLTVVVEESVCG